jgi:predicted nucleotidyltransferase
MTYVDDAFALLKSDLETTDTENNLASTRQKLIREHLDKHWDISDDFLTGSYSRRSKTKPLKDVDIFVVLDPKGRQAAYGKKAPFEILDELKEILEKKWSGKVTSDRMAAVVSYGDDVASFEVVPAFEGALGDPKARGYHIPDTLTEEWIRTDPSEHAEQTTAKNKACAERWIPLVKMIKGANRELGEPVQPSFLLEVMALETVEKPCRSYQDELSWFFATAADRLDESWPDPAGLGPDVNAEMTPVDRTRAQSALRKAHDIAQRAVWLEDNSQEKAAVEEWRRLFGNRMPRP